MPVNDFLRPKLKNYVIDEGYLAFASMVSDLIFNLVKKEFTKRYPTLGLEGIHTGQFRFFASFKTPDLSIYDPVEFHLNLYPCESREIEPKEIFLFLEEIFQKKIFGKEIISNKWIEFDGFSSSGFLFSSTVRPFGGIRYCIVPSISKQSIPSLFPWYPEMKVYQKPIEDFSPYKAYSLVSVNGPENAQVFEWKKILSYAFLVWFENETRDVYNSFNRGYENLSYSYRPFRSAVVVLIYLKMHLLIYSPDLYEEDTIFLITFLCGLTFSQRKQKEYDRSGDPSPFTSFRQFVSESKILIHQKTNSTNTSLWWISHPCDESTNLLESWNRDSERGSEFFQWLDLLTEHFSDSELQKSQLIADEYFKKIFSPIWR
ncbi:MAG: hypothetical protein KGZ90_08855 [Algoriphagus sp.]|nr:hypothetical protein [Algoriphagus sp.]